MKSIFNPTDNAEFIERINKLTPGTPALWGKMNVSQMMAHCQVPIKIAFGELEAKGNLFGLLFGRLAKKKLLEDKPFKRNLPTLKEGLIKDERNFDSEKSGLVNDVKKFTAGPDVITKKPHPFFGPMTVDEWDKLQSKHLDHHLKQFGV
jgi:hypothetical protein